MFSGGIPPEVAAVALIGLATLGCALYTARSLPIAIRRDLRDLRDRVQAAEANLERTEGKVAQRLVELAGLIEEMEGVLESVERKRRRIAAATSAAKQPEAEPERDQTLGALRQRARALGWPI